MRYTNRHFTYLLTCLPHCHIMARRNVRDIPPTLRSATTVSCHWEPRDAVCVIMAMFRRTNGVIQLIYFYAKNNFCCMYYYVFVVLFILVLFTVNALKTVKFLVKKTAHTNTLTVQPCTPSGPCHVYRVWWLMPKLHLFDLLWICCTTNPIPQQIHNKSKQWSLDSICCGLVASLPIRELMLKTY